jgi:hypothetical protein
MKEMMNVLGFDAGPVRPAASPAPSRGCGPSESNSEKLEALSLIRIPRTGR